MFLSEAKEGTTTKPGLFTNAEFPFEDARLRFRSPGQADTVYASRISGKEGWKARRTVEVSRRPRQSFRTNCFSDRKTGLSDRAERLTERGSEGGSQEWK